MGEMDLDEIKTVKVRFWMGNYTKDIVVSRFGGMDTKSDTITAGFIKLKDIPFPSGLLIEKVEFSKNILKM